MRDGTCLAAPEPHRLAPSFATTRLPNMVLFHLVPSGFTLEGTGTAGPAVSRIASDQNRGLDGPRSSLAGASGWFRVSLRGVGGVDTRLGRAFQPPSRCPEERGHLAWA